MRLRRRPRGAGLAPAGPRPPPGRGLRPCAQRRLVASASSRSAARAPPGALRGSNEEVNAEPARTALALLAGRSPSSGKWSMEAVLFVSAEAAGRAALLRLRVGPSGRALLDSASAASSAPGWRGLRARRGRPQTRRAAPAPCAAPGLSLPIQPISLVARTPKVSPFFLRKGSSSPPTHAPGHWVPPAFLSVSLRSSVLDEPGSPTRAV